MNHLEDNDLYTVLSIKEHSEHVICTVENNKKIINCEKCGDKLIMFGRKNLLLRDCPRQSYLQKKIFISFRRRKYLCNSCHKYYTEDVPSRLGRRKFTRQFINLILQECRKKPIVRVADEYYIHERTVHNLLSELEALE